MRHLQFNRLKAFILFFTLFFGVHAVAELQGELSLDGIDKLVLQVSNANLNMNGNSELRRIKFNQEMFSVDKSGSVAVLRQNDFSSSMDPSAKTQTGTVEISGRLIVEIFGRDLRIDTQNWQTDLFTHGNSLKLYLNAGSGFVQASALKIDFVSNEFKGRVKGDFQSGKVILKGSQMDGEISLLNGDLSCEKTSGALTVQSFAAQIKAVKCGGNWSVDNLKGGTVAQGWSGRFEGVSQEGPFAVSIMDEGDVNIKTQSGRVTLTPPAAASVALNLQSTEGDIVTPNYLKVAKEGQKKFLKGRSQGQGEKGSFYVRTQEGVIFVK